MNSKELFENNCFPMCWLEDEEHFKPEPAVRKDLQTLTEELEQIKNTIDDLSAKEWLLSKLMKFHNEGFTTH